MKITAVKGVTVDDSIREEYENAAAFEKVRVGKTGVFIPHNLSARYIPYSYIESASVITNEILGKCCGGGGGRKFVYYRLVLVHDGKMIIDWLTENEEAAVKALAAIAEAAPGIKIEQEK